MQEFSVLFVCLGNICRSPMAEFIFKHKLQQAGLSELVMWIVLVLPVGIVVRECIVVQRICWSYTKIDSKRFS